MAEYTPNASDLLEAIMNDNKVDGAQLFEALVAEKIEALLEEAREVVAEDMFDDDIEFEDDDAELDDCEDCDDEEFELDLDEETAEHFAEMFEELAEDFGLEDEDLEDLAESLLETMLAEAPIRPRSTAPLSDDEKAKIAADIEKRRKARAAEMEKIKKEYEATPESKGKNVAKNVFRKIGEAYDVNALELAEAVIGEYELDMDDIENLTEEELTELSTELLKRAYRAAGYSAMHRSAEAKKAMKAGDRAKAMGDEKNARRNYKEEDRLNKGAGKRRRLLSKISMRLLQKEEAQLEEGEVKRANKAKKNAYMDSLGKKTPAMHTFDGVASKRTVGRLANTANMTRKTPQQADAGNRQHQLRTKLRDSAERLRRKNAGLQP